MTETTPTLTKQLAAVNAYADYLQGDYITRDHRQFPTRNRAVVALKNAALAVLEAAQDWPEIRRQDATHLILLAPDGSHVRYTYEDGAERLTLIEAGTEGDQAPAALPVGLCDYCSANLPGTYLTITVGETSHYVCSGEHARACAALTPGAVLRFEARSPVDRYQFRIEGDEDTDRR